MHSDSLKGVYKASYENTFQIYDSPSHINRVGTVVNCIAKKLYLIAL